VPDHGDEVEAGAKPLERGAVSVGERVVRWSAWGDPEGPIVLDQPHIGEGGARLTHAFAEAIRDAGVRLVTVARPGLGGSSPNPGRTIESDAEDTLRVADALGLERFVLVGRCLATSSVLTLAARHPDRLERLVLVSAMAPFRGEDADTYIGKTMRGIRLLYRWGPIARWSVRQTAKPVRKDALAAVKGSIKHMPAVDRPIASDPETMAVGALELVEMFADEAVALAEFRILAAPWPVDLRTVRTPVTLWHGALDKTAPVAMARWLSRRLAGSRLEILDGVGHMYAPDVERRIMKDVRAGMSTIEIGESDGVLGH
jgi:pimeloyl-ACP methyl ester carboxylesterase